ncbi:MAG: class I SAM-dependent methyltransferase, partial [Nanoarchaeota archaeon]|nr:class I SAM-dependent methyltransferase [Nanoarchaeota archaeon]
PKHAKILEVGCGSGRTLGYYQDDSEIIALDFSKKMIQIARKKFPDIRFILGDMRDLNFDNSSFDAVTFPYSIFHINKKDVVKVLRKTFEILKPCGYLLLILQEGSGEIIIDEPLMPSEKIYFNLYQESEIEEILNDIGFKKIEVGRINPGKGEIPYNKLVFILKKK